MEILLQAQQYALAKLVTFQTIRTAMTMIQILSQERDAVKVWLTALQAAGYIVVEILQKIGLTAAQATLVLIQFHN